MPPISQARPRSSGFTLIEVLVALVLASVGLLGMARVQVAMSSDNDAVVQRLEAQRLLSDKIEDIRRLNAGELDALTAGADAPTPSNRTAYSRRWTVADTEDAAQRLASVTVQWIDRRGQSQDLQATSLMRAPEGRMLAALSEPLLPSEAIRGPLDRNVDVPLDASALGNGRSSFRLQKTTGETVTFLTDDSNSRIVQRCRGAPNLQQLINQLAPGCEPYNAVLLSGFIGGANQVVALGLLGLLNVEIPYPSGVNTSEIRGADSGKPIECSFAKAYDDPLFILQINGSSTYAYNCVIPLAPGASGWSGYLQFDGALSVSLSARVCRYRYPDAPGADPNRRNAQQYRNVTQSLHNQNYLFVVGSSCGSQDRDILVEHQVCSLLGLFCRLNRT